MFLIYYFIEGPLILSRRDSARATGQKRHCGSHEDQQRLELLGKMLRKMSKKHLQIMKLSDKLYLL